MSMQDIPGPDVAFDQRLRWIVERWQADAVDGRLSFELHACVESLDLGRGELPRIRQALARIASAQMYGRRLDDDVDVAAERTAPAGTLQEQRFMLVDELLLDEAGAGDDGDATVTVVLSHPFLRLVAMSS